MFSIVTVTSSKQRLFDEILCSLNEIHIDKIYILMTD
jgi:hypothetical protein